MEQDLTCTKRTALQQRGQVWMVQSTWSSQRAEVLPSCKGMAIVMRADGDIMS